MEALNTLVFNSIDRIFNVLRQVGYINSCNINSVLALTYLSGILNKYSNYITDKDYKYIINAIKCLSENSCLIDLVNFDDLMNKPNKSYESFKYRITEDSINRITENKSLRLN